MKAHDGTVVYHPDDERITHFIIVFGGFNREIRLRDQPELNYHRYGREWRSPAILWRYGRVDQGWKGLRPATKLVVRREWINACVHSGKRVPVESYEVQ